MSRTVMVLLGLLIAGVVFLGTLVASVVGINNNLVTQENGLEAQYKDVQNAYDNHFKKLKEAAQVPEMYASDLEKIYKGALQGRYGEDGSKAVFQFIQEQNPQVDSSVYKQLQQIIEAGRNEFKASQTSLLDKKRVYKISLQTFPNNIVAGALGFPKLDLAKIDIVTSAETEEAFESKKAPPIKLK